jgi:hypothetical protein
MKIYPLPRSPLNQPEKIVSALMLRLECDFWGGAFNGAVLFFCLGWAGMRWLRYGDITGWWLPIQLLLIPVLMATEEFLHMVVMARKEMPTELMDLVVVQQTGRSGFPWLCWGAAARFQGAVSHRDRIHICAPGPFMGLLVAILLWLTCGLLDRHLWWGRAHLTALPTLGYLMSAWFPLPSELTSDGVVVLRARRKIGLSWWQTLRECVWGVCLLWRRE